MGLHAERDGSGPALVLVHGFTQTGRCWGPIADDLTLDHEVVRVDAPGHGRSATIKAGLGTGGRLIADQGGRATYLGYSMGARFCLDLALANPELVTGLVLIGGTAGIESPDERAARAEQDLALARSIEEKGLPRFLDGWLALPMFEGIPPERTYKRERMENTVEGLVSSLEQAGTGTQDATWHRLDQLEMPVLAVAGERDAKFLALAERMVAEVGSNATLGVVPGAGHAAHLEAPDAFLAVLRPWLALRSL
jgi:2-succinyl-6-hydroxy-2,4-cyclohexadiene-1-carboxylate synthase